MDKLKVSESKDLAIRSAIVLYLSLLPFILIILLSILIMLDMADFLNNIIKNTDVDAFLNFLSTITIIFSYIFPIISAKLSYDSIKNIAELLHNEFPKFTAVNIAIICLFFILSCLAYFVAGALILVLGMSMREASDEEFLPFIVPMFVFPLIITYLGILLNFKKYYKFDIELPENYNINFISLIRFYMFSLIFLIPFLLSYNINAILPFSVIVIIILTVTTISYINSWKNFTENFSDLCAKNAEISDEISKQNG